MAVYMITYDIKVVDNFEYPKLYEAIKGISGEWCHPQESVWFVDTTIFSSRDIMAKLQPCLTLREHGGDSIIVIRCTSDSSGYSYKEANDWINSPYRTWETPAYL